MLDLSSLDLEEIAGALAGQTDYEHHWLVNPDTERSRSGRLTPASTGRHRPTPAGWTWSSSSRCHPWVWFQDMADFAGGITDERAGRRLARAIAGKGGCRK